MHISTDVARRRSISALPAASIVEIGQISSEAATEDVGGRLVTAGFVETHIHLDKSCILDRCHSENGTLQEAIAQVAAAKRAFSEEDVYERGRRTLEKAIIQGTTRMRTHVEVDPRIGLRSFAAIQRLQRDYAWAIDLDICVFPQEGLLNDPGTEDLLIAACEAGAELIGGCPLQPTATRMVRSHAFRDRSPLRYRHRFPSRLRSRSGADGPYGGLPADRFFWLWRQGRGRARDQAVGIAVHPVQRRGTAARRCGRRGYGSASD